MIAYNLNWLKNLFIREQASSAYDESCITKDEFEGIKNKYIVGFYSPNVFIGIGLLLLTIIIQLFSFGLIAFVFRDSNTNTFGILAILFSMGCFFALEFMIREKKHFGSGVDEGLLWGGCIALLAGFNLLHSFSSFSNCIIIFIISFPATIRYADRLMATVLFGAVIGLLFYGLIEIGNLGKMIAPFAIIIVSTVVYFGVKKIKKAPSLFAYRNCIMMFEIVSLISIYAAGNYFVERELSNSMFYLQLQPGETIPLGWLFWLLTFIIPIVYLSTGIKHRNSILIRVGILIIAVSIFTVRYYHAFLSIEMTMTIAGTLLFVIAYFLMKWLNEPKFGFTSKLLSFQDEQGKRQLESLIIAETFKPGTNPGGTTFGGGSFGGAGASGEY